MTVISKRRQRACRPRDGVPNIDTVVRAIEIVKGPLKRDKRLTVRVPEAVLERLRIVALADGRSISDWALRAIEREIDLAEAQVAQRFEHREHRDGPRGIDYVLSSYAFQSRHL